MSNTPITDTINGFVAFGATIPGLSGGQSWSLDTFFDAQNAGPVTLPCVLAMPNVRDEQKGWTTQAFLGNAPVLEFTVYHFYLYKLVAGQTNFSHMMPGIDSVLDTYYTALKADPFFLIANPGHGPITCFAPKVRHRVERTDWYGTVYHTVVFEHDIKLNL